MTKILVADDEADLEMLIKQKFRQKIREQQYEFIFASNGNDALAKLLQYHKTDYIAVAYADEGIELRNNGITLPIMVMNPEEQGMDGMIRYRLEPEVYSFRVLDMLEKALLAHAEDLKEPFPVHIKFDTGIRISNPIIGRGFGPNIPSFSRHGFSRLNNFERSIILC